MVCYCREIYFSCACAIITCWFTLVKGKNKTKQTCDSLPCDCCIDNIDRADRRQICWSKRIICPHVPRSTASLLGTSTPHKMLCQGFYTKNQSKLLARQLSKSTYIWFCPVQALILVMASSSSFTLHKNHWDEKNCLELQVLLWPELSGRFKGIFMCRVKP
jgi:hypothetical protein